MSEIEVINSLLERCNFPEPQTKVACAVSGGADSLALMILAVSAGCEVTAIHVDHGLRSGSEKEADIVKEAAERFGASFVGEKVVVTAGPNLEARARSARYAVLPQGVLTGHTADDQAETVLLNLMRGSGIDGLAGMSTANRPIIKLRRADTHKLCAELGLSPVQDPSNDDDAFLRNRVRKEVLPLLDEIAKRDVADLIARQTEYIRDDVDLLDQLSASIDPTDAKQLATTPKALARRTVRNWLKQESDEESHPPSMFSIDRVLAVARGEAIACEIEGARRIARTNQRLRIED